MYIYVHLHPILDTIEVSGKQKGFCSDAEREASTTKMKEAIVDCEEKQL